MPKRPGRTPLRLRVVLALGSAVVALLAAEGVARLAGGQASLRSLHELRPNDPWLYAMRPGATARDGGVHYRINEHGFRDRPRSLAKPRDGFRVAILGDSLTLGYGVDAADTFAPRTEAALSRASAEAQIQVLNFGVSGYNPYNEAALYRGVVRRFEPDLVLVQFCVNDLNDPTLHFDASTVQRLGELPKLAFPNPAERRAPPPALSRLGVACYASRLCGLLLERLWAQTRAPSEGRDWRVTFEIRQGAGFETEWQWLRERYAGIARDAERDGARFAVIGFPYQPQVEGAAEARPGPSRLAALGLAEGWEVIDLLPAFRAAAERGEGPLFLDLWHPSSRGHAVAADALTRGLVTRRLVPVSDASASR